VTGIAERKTRPLWPLLTAALIGLPVLFILSVGLIYGLASRDLVPDPIFDVANACTWPFERFSRVAPTWLNRLMWAYLNFWG